MINTKHFKYHVDEKLDGTVAIEVGVLVKARHTVPAKQALEVRMQEGKGFEFFCRTHKRPLAAAVINHIYGDLTEQVQKLKTLAKLCADSKHELEIQRVCTAIDKLLDMKI